MTRLLDLNGKDLETELQKIIRDNPAPKKQWTQKEIQIVQRLRAGGVAERVIAKELGRSAASISYALTRKQK